MAVGKRLPEGQADPDKWRPDKWRSTVLHCFNVLYIYIYIYFFFFF